MYVEPAASVLEAQHVEPSLDDLVYEITRNDMSVALVSGWMLGHGFQDFKVHGDERPLGFKIETSKGTMIAEPGDYILRLSSGEFIPVTEQVFKHLLTPINK